MIIRLLRGRVPDGQKEALLTRLRAIIQGARQPPPGFVGASFGFRRDRGCLDFLALSTCESLDAIAELAGGAPDRPVHDAGRIVPEITIELYEVDEQSTAARSAGGAALGLVWGRVGPHFEGTAHEMIRAVAPTVSEPGSPPSMSDGESRATRPRSWWSHRGGIVSRSMSSRRTAGPESSIRNSSLS